MINRTTLRGILALVLPVVLIGLFQPPGVGAIKEQIPVRLNQHNSESSVFQALVVNSSRNDLSPNLSDIQPKPERLIPSEMGGIEIPNPVLPKAIPSQAQESNEAPLLLDKPLAPVSMPIPLLNFDGISNLFGGWPPDTQGDIGQYKYKDYSGY